MIRDLESLVSKSFSPEDLTILRSVLNSSISVNIQKLDLIMEQLRIGPFDDLIQFPSV
jgi:hypothetical protein